MASHAHGRAYLMHRQFFDGPQESVFAYQGIRR